MSCTCSGMSFLYNKWVFTGQCHCSKESAIMDYKYVLEGYYGAQYGWEDISEYPPGPEGKKEALDDLASYRENEAEYSFRLKSRKVS